MVVVPDTSSEAWEPEPRWVLVDSFEAFGVGAFAVERRSERLDGEHALAASAEQTQAESSLLRLSLPNSAVKVEKMV